MGSSAPRPAWTPPTRPSRAPQLLPVDPDASAWHSGERIGEPTDRRRVVVSDLRPAVPHRHRRRRDRRRGHRALTDWRGQIDLVGHELHSTVIAVADEITARRPSWSWASSRACRRRSSAARSARPGISARARDAARAKSLYLENAGADRGKVALLTSARTLRGRTPAARDSRMRSSSRTGGWRGLPPRLVGAEPRHAPRPHRRHARRPRAVRRAPDLRGRQHAPGADSRPRAVGVGERDHADAAGFRAGHHRLRSSTASRCSRTRRISTRGLHSRYAGGA